MHFLMTLSGSMQKEFIIKNHHSNVLRLSGVALLRLMHETVSELLRMNRTKADIDDFFSSDSISRVIHSDGWLMVPGHLANFSTSHDVEAFGIQRWFPGEFKIGLEANPPVIKVSGKGVVEFKYCGNDYEAITGFLLNLIHRNAQLTHAKLAEMLINRIQGTPYPSVYLLTMKQKYVLDALLLLMLGVEGSRNNDTLLTALFLLDLIRDMQSYGDKSTRFDWCNAFVSAHGYRWDDYENKNYGGKFPMAQSSTGSGNLGKGVWDAKNTFHPGRSHLISGKKEHAENTENDFVYSEEAAMCIIEKYNQKHAVPRREMSLLIHWLQAYSYCSNLLNCETEDDLKTVIKCLFIEKMTDAFLPRRVPSVLHLLNDYYNSPQNLIGLVQYRKMLKQLARVEAKEKRDSFACPVNRNHFYLTHYRYDSSNTTSASFHGKHHRGVKACKLIPDFALFGKTKRLFDGSTINADIIYESKREDALEKTSERCCPYCFKSTLALNA